MSIRTGRDISRNGGGSVVILPSSSKERRSGLLPSSITVLMYSRPWMPSRVGLTISDMSVHISSNPGPQKGPLYPAPDTGILPVSACFQIRVTISGVQ